MCTNKLFFKIIFQLGIKSREASMKNIYKLKWKTATLFLTVFVSFALNAQPEEIPYRNEPYILDSGIHNGKEKEASLVFSRVIQQDGAPWIRLFFSDGYLGQNSYLKLTSLQDGASQSLDNEELIQWHYSSAYFNGDAVRLDLFVAYPDRNIFVKMNGLEVGEMAAGPMIRSQCGPTDDRISSNDPAVGRIVPIGCTGWIVTNGLMVTAGHCLTNSSSSILEFNVPPSLPSGTIQHPPPEDQYSIIQTSKIFVNGGIGNDYGIFEVFNNSITGLHPIAAQGAAFTVVQDTTPPSIRITGFGVDTGVDNQTQQTHVGPNTGSTNTTMNYQTDTEGGNSGSPVIDDASGFALGVHTHGGCTTSGTGSNHGTSAFHTGFWALIDVPGNFVPDPPENFLAYSDYTTPTSMKLTWQDPEHFYNGDSLPPGDFHIHIRRDGVFIDSVQGGLESYMDNGLIDGWEYKYEILSKVDSTGFQSATIAFNWIAGGSPIPNPPTNLNVSTNGVDVFVSWINPSTNIDDTPMDDLEEIRLYQDSVLVTTFARSSADTAKTDSASFTPPVPNRYSWFLTVADNENPQNESIGSNSAVTPQSAPIADNFSKMGEPNPEVWLNKNADLNDRALNPPSGYYSLNLNGKPAGGDTLELYPVDLSGQAGQEIKLSYFYQPQGTGNVPEDGDSLMIYFRNNLGEWIKVKSYPGTPLKPFEQEVIDLVTTPSGNGDYFHSQFQVRLRSIGSSSITTPNDDWFVDNVFLGPVIPAIGVSEDSLFFDTTAVGSSSAIQFEVHNIGLDTLQVTSISTSNSQFSVDSTFFNLASGAKQIIQVTFAPTQGGNQNTVLQISSNDPSNGSVEIYVTGVGEQITSISETSGLPTQYAVKQNYPNPFNPNTVIHYQLPQRSEVSLVVYDLLGKQIRSLLNRTVEAGYHNVEWDGKNNSGTQVSSGIYIYWFKANEFTHSYKMILMK
jgi:hypothetical protein